MPAVPFPYPGNKARLSDWILNYIPEHKCFVSVFGGAGGIIFNKEPSDVEVYNDKDNELVNFFTVLREHEEELVEWLERFPFSREMHEEWANKFYDNTPFEEHVKKYSEKHNSDPIIVRAGLFFFLRYGQWGSKYGSNSGFAFSKVTNDAESFSNARDRLDIFADRFDGVVIECLDWEHCMDNYDGEDTVFYLDPPYYKDTSDQHYRETGFNHSRFVRYLGKTDAKWVLSYAKMPPGLEDYHIESKQSKFMIGNGKSGEAKETVEHLITNFDPANTSTFHSLAQGGLNSFANDSNKNIDDGKESTFEDNAFEGFETASSDAQEEEVTEDRIDEAIDDIRNGDGEHDKEIADAIENDRDEKDTESNIASSGKLDGLQGIASGNNESTNEQVDEEIDEEDDKFEGFLEDVSA